MTLFHFSGIRFRLIILVLLALIPALGLIVYTGLERRGHDRDIAMVEAINLARITCSAYEHLIESTSQLLMSLGKTLPGPGHATCPSVLADLLQLYPTYYTGLLVANRNGDVLCSAPAITRPVNLADRDWFQRLVQTKKSVVSDYLVGRISGKKGIVVASPIIEAEGEIVAIVAANLDKIHLGQLLAEMDLPQGLVLTLFDSKGTVLARNIDSDKWVGKVIADTSFARAALTLQREGTMDSAGEDGVMRLYAFRPLVAIPAIDDTKTYISVGVPIAVALAPAERNLRRSLALLALVAGISFLTAWFGADVFLLRRIQALVRATERLSAGDLRFRTGPPYGKGEIARLSRAFDEMAEALDQREAERKQAEEARIKTAEHLRLIIEDIFRFVPEALLVFTNKGSLFKTNKSFHDLVREYSGKLNYTEEELAETILKEVKKRIANGDHTEIKIPKKQG